MRPGVASKRRAPNCLKACSQTGAGGGASMTATVRLWLGNKDPGADLVLDVKKIQRFDGPTFEADVLKAEQPVVVDFYADWCHPCHMMEPAVEQLAGEFAGKVTVGKLNVDDNPE